MTTFIKPMLVAGILTFGGLIISVQNLAKSTIIEIAPGYYSPKEVLDLIKNQNISISYSESSLKLGKVNIKKSKNRLDKLLSILFDLESYDYLIKGSKILIVPKSTAKLNRASGSLQWSMLSDGKTVLEANYSKNQLC